MALVVLLQEMIIVQGLLLNEAHIFLRWFLSMLFRDLKAPKLKNIPTLPMMVLSAFFHADAETNIHPLPVSLYFNSCSLSSWVHMMSILYIPADAATHLTGLLYLKSWR